MVSGGFSSSHGTFTFPSSKRNKQGTARKLCSQRCVRHIIDQQELHHVSCLKCVARGCVSRRFCGVRVCRYNRAAVRPAVAPVEEVKVGELLWVRCAPRVTPAGGLGASAAVAARDRTGMCLDCAGCSFLRPSKEEVEQAAVAAAAAAAVVAAGGCGPGCSLSHSDDGECLVCHRGWGSHSGHNCSGPGRGGTRGSWLVGSNPAARSAAPAFSFGATSAARPPPMFGAPAPAVAIAAAPSSEVCPSLSMPPQRFF